MEVKEIVIDILNKSEAPLKSGEIAEKANLDKKEIDKALKILKKEESIISPKRCYYAAK